MRDPITPERWLRLTKLLEATLEREPETREVFLAQATADDPALANEVLRMLHSDEKASGFLSASPRAGPEESLDAPELAPGTNLGQYRIVEQVGSGGMGTVYKATDTNLGRQVALKLLRPELLKDASALARFEREARMLASLNQWCWRNV